MFLQVKHDGERRGVFITSDGIEGANRKGLRTDLRPIVHDSLAELQKNGFTDTTLDCEDLRDRLVVFDVLSYKGKSLSEEIFSVRADLLSELKRNIKQAGLEETIIVDLPVLADSIETLKAFIASAKNENAEGIVLRDGYSAYKPGRPASGGSVLKLKFVERATLRVATLSKTRRSIGVEALDENDWISVGNCSIPANQKIPSVGELVEIEYLYAFDKGALFQPVYRGSRQDLDEKDSVISQLKYKNTKKQGLRIAVKEKENTLILPKRLWDDVQTFNLLPLEDRASTQKRAELVSLLQRVWDVIYEFEDEDENCDFHNSDEFELESERISNIIFEITRQDPSTLGDILLHSQNTQSLYSLEVFIFALAQLQEATLDFFELIQVVLRRYNGQIDEHVAYPLIKCLAECCGEAGFQVLLNWLDHTHPFQPSPYPEDYPRINRWLLMSMYEKGDEQAGKHILDYFAFSDFTLFPEDIDLFIDESLEFRGNLSETNLKIYVGEILGLPDDSLGDFGRDTLIRVISKLGFADVTSSD